MDKFPKFIPNFDKIIKQRKKADKYQILPKGSKGYLWFTTNNNNDNIALLLFTDKNGDIKRHSEHLLCFDKSLVYGIGTIFEGVLYDKNNFIITDSVYYKGFYTLKHIFKHKFDILQDFLNNRIKNISSTFNHINISMPVICNSFKKLHKYTSKVQYPIYGIKCIDMDSIYSKGIVKVDSLQQSSSIMTDILTITADLDFDIYHYKKCDNNMGILCIPDYKTSVMMNKLFRKIKENDNLDLLEESDDEDEFQDVSVDKYLIPDKSIDMYCKYDTHRKKWIPIKIKN